MNPLSQVKHGLDQFRAATFTKVSLSMLANADRKRLLSMGFSPNIESVGHGKDGRTYRTTRLDDPTAQSLIVKVLSDYGREYLPQTQRFFNSRVSWDGFYDVEIVDNQIFVYLDEQLVTPPTDPAAMANSLAGLCEMQTKLLEKNLVFWDMGLTGLNYMQTQGAELRWIDYGGNGILCTDRPADAMQPGRANLIFANNRFVQLQLLIHIAVWGLHQKRTARWGTQLQDSASSFDSIEEKLKNVFSGTTYESLSETILASDLLEKSGWDSLNACCLELAQESFTPLEDADIDAIRYEDGVVIVQGYQNYELRHDGITAKNSGHRWANSLKKYDIVNQALAHVEAKTHLDIGSNLGMYVFTAAVNHGLVTQGVDYNDKYVVACNKIANHVDVAAKFSQGDFGGLTGNYDFVTMLGVIHHLYQRTEGWGDLEPIVTKLAEISKQALVEFPTEKDSKAYKWTSMAGRNVKGEYSLAEFLRLSRMHFAKVEPFGCVTKHRPVYLLSH